MKLTNTIKTILSEFSRGKCSEGFSLISEHLRTSIYPCVLNTDVWGPGMDALLLVSV